MRITDIIAAKRDGGILTAEQIQSFITGYTEGSIEDYQAAALVMAIYLRGMSRQETIDLTLAMAHSGDVLDLKDVLPISIDKHSSGGVGDKTTLIVLPMVAACGVPVAKMSGRGLGFSGGTLDKLEAIPGYRVGLSMDEFRAQAARLGLVLAGQSGSLAPADGKLYALRDATATVDCLPLIASSIMSKKIAAGADSIVLDVKVGRGAFMSDLESARALASLMVEIGDGAGRKTTALLSDMNQPLGGAVGNALEVQEAIACLQNRIVDRLPSGDKRYVDSAARDLLDHCLLVAAHMLRLAARDADPDITRYQEQAARTLEDGSALAKFRELVEAQGGDPRYVDDPTLYPEPKLSQQIAATQDGYIGGLEAREIGVAAVELGAGREKKSDTVDHAVGILVHKKTGDSVRRGEPLFTVLANDPEKMALAVERLRHAAAYSADPVDPLPLVYDVLL